jgi:hypothetical protein
MDEFPHQIFDVPADVSSLGKLGCIPFHERHPDQIRDFADQVSLPDAGRPEHDDVLFRVFFPAFPSIRTAFNVVVVIAYRRCQDFLGVVLFDDEPVEVVLDIAGEIVELQVEGSFFSLGTFVCCPRLVWLGAEHAQANLIPILPAEKLLHVSA